MLYLTLVKTAIVRACSNFGSVKIGEKPNSEGGTRLSVPIQPKL
jgi:hypothetical protein